MTKGRNEISKSEKQSGWSKMRLKQKYLVRLWRDNLEKRIGDNKRILEIYFSVAAAVFDSRGLMV